MYLDVRLDLDAKLLEMLNDGAINRSSQVSVLVSNGTSPVTNLIIDILQRKFVYGSKANDLDRYAPANRLHPRIDCPI